MQIGLYEGVSIISDIFGAYIIYRFMEVFFDTRKFSKTVEITSYAVYYIIGTLLFIFMNIPVVLMIYSLVAFFALSYNYESTVKNRILSALFIYSILVIVEIIVGLLSGYLNFSLFSADKEYSSAFGMISCRIISFAIVLVMNNFKNIKRGESVPNSNWFAIALIPVASLYVILLIFQAKGISIIQIMVSVILILLINFATFYLYDFITAALSDKMQSMLILEQNKYYDKQLETIKTSLHTTNAIRHDLKNHMFSIRSLIECGDTKETLNYIAKIMEDIGASKDHSSTGNTVIDSIINFKLQEAVQRGIKANLDLKIPENLNIPSFDMTVILGNLLDNAMIAVYKVKENPFINLKIEYDKGRLMIQVANPYEGKIIEENGMILTTHENKENHGIGLQSVKKVIQKYDGIMNIEYCDSIFSVTLFMYVD
ncbi:MAG: GHKL domain-containing protein [Eubacteriales bacterium]|nr:GHKL domain-containing protein [Eubacteriales bacterium]